MNVENMKNKESKTRSICRHEETVNTAQMDNLGCVWKQYYSATQILKTIFKWNVGSMTWFMKTECI